ncbi:MAG TPA: IS630 family transposase [Verrucomicrobia subdivision 3 bacterium]|nr:IS630 family transposase [Limisphaerales bacterium]
MPKQFHLNRPELEHSVATALRTCERVKDHQRLISMRLAASGKFTAAQIAKHVQVSRRQFFLWVAAFKKGGVIGLLERKHGGGAPSKFSNLVKVAAHDVEGGSTSASTPHPAGSNQQPKTGSAELQPVVKALIEILHHDPNTCGINRSSWTLKSLAQAFEKQYGQRPSTSRVGQLLKEAGFRWKKSRQVLTSPDPNYKEKVELLLKTLQSLKADEDLFFIDEMGPLAVRRHGGRCYTPKGETPTHPQNQRTKGSITLYGALSAKTNQVVWFYGKSKDSAGMIELVEILYNQQHDKSKIFLTWDAASWHRSEELVQWTDAFNTWNIFSGSGPHIAFIPLPSNSQFLDVIEAVFSGMKGAVIHNSDYQSPAEMKAAISMHFRERNDFFRDNPKRVGKKMWEIDFFDDHNNIRWGNYREW